MTRIIYRSKCNSDNIPNLTDSTNNGVTEKGTNKYCMLTDKYLHEIHVPTEVISCKNISCSDENHIRALIKCTMT